MTHIFQPKPGEEAKWRVQATKAGEHLKKMALTKEIVKIGFGFDDGVITVEIVASDIRSRTARELGDFIYRIVLYAARGGTKAETVH